VAQSTEQLKSDIAVRREEIGRDLEAIGNKVSPSQMVERRKESAKAKVQNVRESIMGSADSASTGASRVGGKVQELPDLARQRVQGSPLGVGLVAFGAGLIVASMIKPTRAEQRAVEQVQPELERAAGDLRQAGQEAAIDLRDHAQEAVSHVSQSAKDAVQSESSSSASSANPEPTATRPQAPPQSQPTAGGNGGPTSTF
jgi:hypothetical protein